MKISKNNFTSQYPIKYLEYLDVISISVYNDAVKIYPRDGGLKWKLKFQFAKVNPCCG